MYNSSTHNTNWRNPRLRKFTVLHTEEAVLSSQTSACVIKFARKTARRGNGGQRRGLVSWGGVLVSSYARHTADKWTSESSPKLVTFPGTFRYDRYYLPLLPVDILYYRVLPSLFERRRFRLCLHFARHVVIRVAPRCNAARTLKSLEERSSSPFPARLRLY